MKSVFGQVVSVSTFYGKPLKCHCFATYIHECHRFHSSTIMPSVGRMDKLVGWGRQHQWATAFLSTRLSSLSPPLLFFFPVPGVPALAPRSARLPLSALAGWDQPPYIRGGEEVQYRLAATVIGKEVPYCKLVSPFRPPPEPSPIAPTAESSSGGSF
jgi:hypothetical protein